MKIRLCSLVEKTPRSRFFQSILNPVKAKRLFQCYHFLDCLAQVGLRGGSGVEERLIIEWMVIERNVLRTVDTPKYNAKTTIKYTVEPHYDKG